MSHRAIVFAASVLILAGDGLSSIGSNVTLADCMLRGGPAFGPWGMPGGDGAVISGGTLFASGSTFTGDHGGPPSATCVLGMCFCYGHGPGGSGLILTGASPSATVLDCSFVPGAGGFFSSSCPGPSGQPVLVDAGTFTTLPGSARHYTASSPVRGGGATTLTLEGVPGDLVYGVFWTTPAYATFPGIAGVLLIGGPPSIIPLGIVPPVGTLTGLIPLFDPFPGLTGVTVFTQAFFDAGSAAFLGPASALTILSSLVP